MYIYIYIYIYIFIYIYMYIYISAYRRVSSLSLEPLELQDMYNLYNNNNKSLYLRTSNNKMKIHKIC